MSDALTYISYTAFNNTPFINNLPNGAIFLGKCLFMYKGEMQENTSYSVPDGTTQVCGRAFYACRNLASITIPNSVTSIGSQAFYGCINLKSAVIGNGATAIPYECFKGCVNLETAQFGSGVSLINDNSFDDCSNVTTIISGATTPPDLSYYSSHEELDPFKSVNKWTTTVYVPDGCVSAYQRAYGWKDFLYIMGNEDVSIDGGVEVCLDGGVLHCGGVDTEVYTLSGAQVYSGSGDVELAAGAYIVVANGRATKVVVK